MGYIPCLRWKLGERNALKELVNAHEYFVPLFFSKSLKMLESLNSDLNSYWKKDCIIDVSRIEISNNVLANTVASCELLGSNRSIALSIEQLSQLDLRIVTESKIGLSFRLDVSSDPISLESSLDALVAECNSRSIPISQYVIVDMGANCDQQYSGSLAAALNKFSSLNYDVKLVLSSGSFPTQFADIGSGFAERPRLDFMLWMSVQTHVDDLIYSDYCVVSPTWEQQLGGGKVPSLLKYTYKDYWVIGRDPENGADVTYSLTNLFVNLRSEYQGPNYSWADNIWWERSKVNVPSPKPRPSGQIGPGNSTFHISEATQHHIMFVLKTDFGLAL
jgi:hypothetical protein